MAHKHAELMMQYAQDAMETDTPWDRWQVKSEKHWHDFTSKQPEWDPELEYRRKPQTSRQRFEAWARSVFLPFLEDPEWAAWQEAERQAKDNK